MGDDAEAGRGDLGRSIANRKGGYKATSFIYALAALENMGVVANMVSLVLYFSYKMYFDLSTSANTLTNLMGSTYLLSTVGGFISDTYLNRFLTCLVFGTLEVLGMVGMVRRFQEKKNYEITLWSLVKLHLIGQEMMLAIKPSFLRSYVFFFIPCCGIDEEETALCFSYELGNSPRSRPAKWR